MVHKVSVSSIMSSESECKGIYNEMFVNSLEKFAGFVNIELLVMLNITISPFYNKLKLAVYSRFLVCKSQIKYKMRSIESEYFNSNVINFI